MTMTSYDRSAALRDYETVMRELVAEVRQLAAADGYPLDGVTDAEVLHRLARLRDAVGTAGRKRSHPSATLSP